MNDNDFFADAASIKQALLEKESSHNENIVRGRDNFIKIKQILSSDDLWQRFSQLINDKIWSLMQELGQNNAMTTENMHTIRGKIQAWMEMQGIIKNAVKYGTILEEQERKEHAEE